jgi:hypothetical protein
MCGKRELDCETLDEAKTCAQADNDERKRVAESPKHAA